MLIFTGFYAFYGACLVIASTAFPGWATSTSARRRSARSRWCITFGFAGGFTGGLLRQPRRPVLDGVRRARRRDRGVRGRGRLRADAGYLIAMLTAVLAVYVGNWIEKKMRVDDVVGAVAVHGVSGFLGHHLGRRLRGRLPDRREQRRLEHRRTAARRGHVPAARLPVRLGRVLGAEEAEPAARAAGGRDRRPRHVEYEPDIYLPEVGRVAGDARRAGRDTRRRPGRS